MNRTTMYSRNQLNKYLQNSCNSSNNINQSNNYIHNNNNNEGNSYLRYASPNSLSSSVIGIGEKSGRKDKKNTISVISIKNR